MTEDHAEDGVETCLPDGYTSVLNEEQILVAKLAGFVLLPVGAVVSTPEGDFEVTRVRLFCSDRRAGLNLTVRLMQAAIWSSDAH